MNFTQSIIPATDAYNLLLMVSAMLLLAVYVTPVVAEEPIGDVVFARGVVSAQNSSGQARILGKNAAIFRGDTITTATKSFTVLRLNDGTRISVRPDTILAINDYADKAGEENATMRLFRGGLRAISGLISKRDPEAFRIKTAVATIGIRGTEFDARLCEADCAKESADMKIGKAVSRPLVVGRVAFLKGKVTGQEDGKAERTLTRGAPLYESDVITTAEGAYAILAFRDEGRITLTPGSRFKIEQYTFNSADPDSDSSFFRLMQGGMRALTGLMSKRSPESYKVRTAVATIGIRGTGFDLLWLGPCTTSTDCGLVASVWQGAISSDNEAGIHDIGLDQIARIDAINLAPEFLDNAPVFNVPRPDTIDIDFANLFARQKDTGAEPGLYVACYEGHCKLFKEDQELDLGAGEAGFADEDRLVRLEQIEGFQQNDPYLQTINELFDTLYELLDDNVIEETEFECVVQ